MKKASVFLWGIASILLCADFSLADLVTLRGGATQKGRVMSLDRTSDQVVIEVPGTGI